MKAAPLLAPIVAPILAPILALAAVLLSAPAAAALEVTFYPGARIYAYEASAERGVRTLVVQTIGIRNDAAAPVTLDTVAIELLSGERVIESRTLGAPELTRAASNGARMQGQMWAMLAFQFGGDRLVPAGTTFSDDLVLAPGEAIVINSQVFAYRGARDAVRVRVNGDAGTARIPVREGVSQTVFQFPLLGQWYNGAGASLQSHHRWSPMEEFAFDLVKLGPDFKTHRGAGHRFADYYAYGQPVFAAAEGRVASVIADQQEDTGAMQRPGETTEAYYRRLGEDQQRRLAQGRAGITGNSVVIDHGNGEYSFYAHLKPGSVLVAAGDDVARGQRIGAVGSSGNSTEPHLHFQVCDSPDPLLCAGIPVQFEPTSDPLGDPPHAPQTGEFLSRP